MYPEEPNFRLPPEFQGFNPRAAMRNYERNLPHWRQPGATYFLTFRLNDSVPLAVTEEVRREREAWQHRLQLEREQHDGDVTEDSWELYQAFLVRTWRRLEHVMDSGHGSCLLRDPRIREVVSSALTYFHQDRADTHGYVVMPNHVHVLVRPLGEWQPEQLLHSWKSYTAHEINKRFGHAESLWQEDTWNRIVRDDEHWHRVMRYQWRNPRHARLLQGQSTVWVWDQLIDTSCSRLREDGFDEEPW
ncbi:MAG: transposase [Verrucomicrobiaceae bacterium]|nr:transposase [Verrucomicrobiaceae bacterium]